MCPMRVKSNRGDLAGENGDTHRFPAGMHVLAVDDDKTCLEILEKMLRKCQYQVTTESRAVEALRMLRENRNKYDLVISDVKMPDIGGMELLKVVGLEMDLPVIMLSAYGDTELVMEGITHGACDYLLKPVRMQELKNIWQHVIRRRKFEAKDQNNDSTHCPDLLGSKEGGLGPTSSGNDYQSENSNRKRKDHIGEDEEEDDAPEDDDESSRQKKPRVVWSMELHQKFVVAVSQLGLDKAVPKKILDLMNVEGLTRENVASHLQKFRIYLKKMQDKRLALGGKNSYIPMSALDGFRDFHSSVGSGRFSNPSLSSYPQGGRLNSLAGLRLIQPTLSQNLSSSYSYSNLQSSILPSNQSSSLFQGFPSSLDYKDFGSINDPTSSSKSIANAPSNPLMTLNRGGFCNQPSIGVGSGTQSCIEFGANGSSNDSWQSGVGVQLGTFVSNSLPSSEPFDQSQVLVPNSFLDTFAPSPSTSHISNNPLQMSSMGQGGLIGNVAQSYSHGMNDTSSTLHSLQNNFVNSTETYTSLTAQSHSGLGTGLRSEESQDWYIESLDDLMNTMDKREQRATTLLDA